MINLFSNTIFVQTIQPGSSFTPRLGTLCIGFANLIGAYLSVFTLTAFNRRTILLFGHTSFAIIHFYIGFSNDHQNNIGVLIGMFCFVLVYMNTTGPMCWIYAAETTIDVSLGFCLATLYMWVVVLSLGSPIVM